MSYIVRIWLFSFIINPYPVFSITERVFWKKLRFITGDVIVGTQKIKIICTDGVSVELYYGANFKWYMPIWKDLCGINYAVMNKNICNFFGPWASVFSGKKSKAQKHIKISSMLRSGFFLTARWWSQKMAYIFVQHGICPHKLAYTIWNLHHSIA